LPWLRSIPLHATPTEGSRYPAVTIRFGIKHPMSAPEPTNKSRPLSWTSCAISEVGRVRKHNEDSFLEQPETGLWVVADGMGGHAKGDLASKMIVDVLKKSHEGTSLVKYVDEIEDRLLNVNQKLIEKARASAKRATIGSTVAILLAYDKYCVYMWTGDSRIYRLRDGEMRQITTDHSQVELYIEQGMISREEALVHPHGNMITRAIGATEELYVDMDMQEMQRQDRYLLCSDGLTKHMQDVELESHLIKGGSAAETCKTLIDLTLSRGAIDNVTAIIVDIQ
jgi:serine/threonine protein phosphatase PrpC